MVNFLRNLILSVIFISAVSGCSQPMRTLMELGREKDAQENYVVRARSRFKALLGDVQKGRLKIGTAKTDVTRRYGEPVLEDEDVLLYRDPVDFMHSTKVYLTFDADKRLIKTRIDTRDGQ